MITPNAPRYAKNYIYEFLLLPKHTEKNVFVVCLPINMAWQGGHVTKSDQKINNVIKMIWSD